MWNPLIASIIWRIPWSASNSCAKTLNQVGLENCTRMCCKWNLTNLQNILTIFEIVLLAAPYISPTVNIKFKNPSLCNDIATLFSIEISSLIRVIFICKCGLNLSQRNLNVLWDTQVIFLNFFRKKYNPIIMYWWTIHISQIPTHYDRSCSFSQSNC